MKTFSLSLIFLLNFIFINAQNNNITKPMKQVNLPYHQIPVYPKAYNAATVTARMIDGLGYRYYWATEDLREADLLFSPGNDGRNTAATLDHILGLSNLILNAILQKPNIQSADQKEMTWEQKRKKTLENFQHASELLKKSRAENLKDYKIIFQRENNSVEYPFWNMLNGPIADAIYHVGQVVSFRRSAGNPINPKVSVLVGKNRE